MAFAKVDSATRLANQSESPGTLSITLTAGVDLLVLHVGWYDNSLIADYFREGGAPTIVGYGAFSFIADANYIPNGRRRAELWYYLAPPSGSLTINVPRTDSVAAMRISAASFSVGAGSIAAFEAAASNATGNSTSPSININTATDTSLCVAAFGSAAGNLSGESITGGTKIYTADEGNTIDGYSYGVETAAGSMSIGWQYTESNYWGVAGGSFREIPSASGTLAVTLDGATVAATGEVVTTSSAGTLAVTLDGATVSAQGSVVTPSLGTLAKTLDGATLVATGDVESLNPVGQLAVTLDGATVAAAGAVIHPWHNTDTLKASRTTTATLSATRTTTATLKARRTNSATLVRIP